MPYAKSADGTQLFFETRGADEAPVLLVGYPWNEGWLDIQFAMEGAGDGKAEALEGAKRLVDLLAAHFRVVLFDYPRGCGRSEGPRTQDLRPETMAQDYVALADAVGAQNFVALGYSWSGVMAKQVIIRTERCKGIVCGGWPPLDAPYEGILAQVRAITDMLPEGHVKDVMMTNRRCYEAIVADFDEAKAIEQLAERDLFLQCFVGSEDQGVPDMGLPLPIAEPIMANRARLEALGWRVDILPGLDHMAVTPDTVADVVIDFLRDKKW